MGGGPLHGVRAQARRVCAAHRFSGGDCYQGGGQERHLHTPWLVQDQDADEAGHEGWQEGGLRQGGHGEGEAREEDCEGLPRRCSEGERLKSCRSRGSLLTCFSWANCGRGSASACKPRGSTSAGPSPCTNLVRACSGACEIKK